ncbi:DUF1540 domain-containing protein [Metallumcola ferriviriculae]|uniref:DUF1540 domain-containing protein n=1 Tax=Metallumcola ferriviriculae TaxID=3039180 RepID=A0AAU0UN47_9FIRM|nr:DUF1540 domain-containing protein [Desulfitibacteraceae bacterium MK1]
MEVVNCEAYNCTHNDDGICELDEITITQRGVDTHCGDFDRDLTEDETTIVFSYEKADDTLDTMLNNEND